MDANAPFLLPLREKVTCEAGRMRGRANLSAMPAARDDRQSDATPHLAACGVHLLPQGEKEASIELCE